MKSSTLDSWLQDRLRERGLDQQQLAAQAKIAAGMIARIERGHVPGPKVLAKLADFFGEDLGTLLEIAGVLHLTHLPEEQRAELKGLAGRLFRLPKPARKTILRQFGALMDLLENGWTVQISEPLDGDVQAGRGLISVSVNIQFSTTT